MKKKVSLLLWLLAFILTLLLAVYQRLSGPTYPLKGKDTRPGLEIKYKFFRSWTSFKPLPIRVAVSGTVDYLDVIYDRFPIPGTKEQYVTMKKNGSFYEAELPGQPAAGKLIYRIHGTTPTSGTVFLPSVVARFKGEVPTALLIFHVIFMFAGLLLALRTGLEALRRDGRWQKLVPWTLAMTSIGGLILGPLVQKYAFGAFWTGFPLGGDLTDSKTIFAVLFWLAAFFLRKKSRWWPLAATVLMVVVYLIPHSMLGSELNYQTGKIETAKEVRGSTLKIK
ncbi:MAG: hypothetical protein KJ808_05255 [Acidobacteria bacterium]|nr:hypothetical protein [Acidobacteriota bacterium]MBU4307309.1 hypothetical protein [Acidobacteriota bacterium]MBU4405105.1 hypothetical protein [Acidobacteriota bacterium]MCG2811708.1 hypothetical protein [Candidatus Aminicenantes bacterium]